MLDWIKTKTTKTRKQFSKYNFFVKSTPQHIDSSTTLTLTTYTNTTEIATIPCRYRWSIIKNGLTIEVPEFKGSSFKCEPSDVGAVIQAEVISTDSEYGGTAVIQFGPVKLDVTLKKQVQIALSSGCTTMPIYLCSNGQQKQCQIRLFQDLIKINHAYSQTNYTFDYSIFEPRVECVSKDSCRVVVVFGEKYEVELRRFLKKLFDYEQIGGGNGNNNGNNINNNYNYNNKDLFSSAVKNNNKDLFGSSVKSTHSSSHNLPSQHQQPQPNNSNNNNTTTINKLDIKFMNRSSRDIFLFTMKAFNTKKQLRSSIILNKIQKIDFTNQETFDYLLEIESLKSQLVKMDSVIKKSYQQKFRYMQQVRKLQRQIQQIIVTYTRIVEQKFMNNAQLSRDYSMLSAKRDQVLTKKYKHLQNENNHLNSRLQTLSKEIDMVRFKPQGQGVLSLSLIQPVQQSSQGNNLQQQLQQKVHFNYENYMSPFTKKRSNQLQDNSQIMMVGNILDELGQSRISCISSIKEDPQLKSKLQQVQREKQQLQKKLQKSFFKIDNLQKDLFMKQQLLMTGNNNNLSMSQQQQHGQQLQKMNYSAVNFGYNNNNTNESALNITQPLMMAKGNNSMDKQIATQNKQLKKSNQMLKLQRQQLIQQLKSSKKQLQLNQSNHKWNENNKQLDNSLNFLKTQKKQSVNNNNNNNNSLTQKQKQLIQALARKDSQVKLLRMQNQQLKKTNQKLRKSLQTLKATPASTPTISQQKQLLKKVHQLQEQIQMYRKNSDALNRSQQLSMQMDTYNQQQIIMLKQHNQFLTLQNEKLSKACQRYMTQAKETNKLRMEIIKLKQKINQIQLANSNNNSTVVLV